MIGAVEGRTDAVSARALLQSRQGESGHRARQGKKLFDKRSDEKAKDDQRDMQRALRTR